MSILEEAIKEYERAIKIDPSSALAHYNLGVVHDRQNRLNKAIQEYQKAVELKPDYAKAQQALWNAVAKRESKEGSH